MLGFLFRVRRAARYRVVHEDGAVRAVLWFSSVRCAGTTVSARHDAPDVIELGGGAERGHVRLWRCRGTSQ